MALSSFIFGGNTNETPESLARRREVQDALAAQIMGKAPTTALGGIGALLSGAALGYGRYRDNKTENAGRQKASDLFSSLMSGNKPSDAATTQTTPVDPMVNATPTRIPGTMANARTADRNSVQSYAGMDLKSGIKSTADALGIDPADLATAISYETAGTFDPTKAGPTTQWGRHRGLIQFGEPQAKQYGVDWNDPLNSQLGPEGAVAKYLRDAGVQPGMGLKDIYSAINAGKVGRYNASDANNGGAPGTVADKVAGMDDHRRKALALLGMDQPNDAQSTMAAMMGDPAGKQPQQVQVADNSNQLPAQQTQQTAQNTQQQNNALPGVDPRLVEAMANPWISAEQKAVIKTMIEQQMQKAQAAQEEQTWKAHKDYETQQNQADPAYQLGLKKGQIELNALQNPSKAHTLTSDEKKALGLPEAGVYQMGADGKVISVREPEKPASEWAKLDDGSLYNQRTGEVKRLPIDPQQPEKFRFPGNSPEAAALNGLIESGQLTPQQAQQIAAGKSITGPNGELLFATPQALIGGQNQNQNPNPVPADDGAVNLFQNPADNSGGVNLFPNGAQPVNPVNQNPALQNQGDATQPRKDGMIQLTAPRVTESEKNAMTYADRMNQSGAILDKMGMKGTDKADQLLNDWLPFGTGSYLTSDDFKTVEQAKRDFVNAQLRRESGAAISPTEFESANQQYFPQPNDPPELLEQKRRNRQLVIDGMIRDAGPTYTRPENKTKTNNGDPHIEDLLKKYGAQ